MNKKDSILDMTRLNWSKTRNSSGTVGTFLKSYEMIDNKKYYYKLSNYDSYKGIIGHECINEIIVSRLLDILGINHLKYDLIHGRIQINNNKLDTWFCSSLDFKEKDDSKISFEIFYQMYHKDKESPLELCKRYGFENKIYEMLVVDYLILNRDRHGANIEILKNNEKNNFTIAPLFDHGMSLFCTCNNYEDTLKQDLLEDRKVQCFVGSNSTYDNLSLIPKNKLPKLKKLDYKDKEIILKDLDQAIDSRWLDRIFDMIYERYKVYENLRNKR